MTVEETGRVDVVARSPEGRLVLVMTEDRFYADGDPDRMADDLAAKLNAYVGLIRSGRLPDLVGGPIGPGVDIELSTMDEPPDRIVELVATARKGLQRDRVDVRHRVLPPQPPERLYDLLGAALGRLAPEGWQRVDATVTLVGRGLSGSLVATLADGSRVPLPPHESLVDGVRHLKRSMYEPGRGTFVTFRATLVPRSITPDYDFGEPSEGAAGFTDRDWAEELRRYPRDPVPDWWPVIASPPVAEARAEPRRRGWFGRRT